MKQLRTKQNKKTENGLPTHLAESKWILILNWVYIITSFRINLGFFTFGEVWIKLHAVLAPEFTIVSQTHIFWRKYDPVSPKRVNKVVFVCSIQ